MAQVTTTPGPTTEKLVAGQGATAAGRFANASWRLGWMAGLVGVVAAATAMLAWVAMQVADEGQRSVLVLQGSAAFLVVLGSILVAAIASQVRMTRDQVYWFALGYLMPVAFAAGVVRHAAPWADQPRGWAAMAVPIAVYPVIVHCSPARAVAAGAVMLAAGVAAYLFTLLLGNPPAERWVFLFRGEALAIAAAWVVARVVAALEERAEQARTLGRYELTDKLGEGGMGEVWRARHGLLARPAVVKLIRPERLTQRGMQGRDEVVARFEREAQATAALECPHTITLYDYGVTADGALYYVMEHLHGTDLFHFVRRYGPMSEARVAHVLRQVCLSLAEAHARSLVHRDIKPSNVFLCKYGIADDFVKVLDFGLVALLLPQDVDANLTTEGVSLGTPGYMSPEQCRGVRELDGRTDLYALGCVAYFLLCGRAAFEGDNRYEVISRQMEEPPVPLNQQIAKRIHPELESVVMDCMQLEPDDRPQSAIQVHDRLAAIEFDKPWTRARAAMWWARHADSLFD